MIILLGVIVVSTSAFQTHEGAISFSENKIKTIRGILIINFKLDLNAIFQAIDLIESREKPVFKALIFYSKVICHRYLVHRTKRGLINLGGQILKVLFGTATTDQISSLEKKLSIQSREISDLHEDTNVVRNTFKNYEEALNLTASEIEKLDKKISDFVMAEEALQLCQSYDRLITDAKHQELDLTIFDISKIKQAIHEFEDKFGLTVLESISDTEKFQKTIRTTVIQNHILLTIFFIDPEEITQHTKIVSFPMISSLSEEFKFQIKLDQNNLIISNKTIGIVGEEFISSCLQFDLALLLCKPYLKFPVERLSETCVFNLIKNQDVSNCKYEKVPINSIRLLETQYENIVSGVPGDVISLTCKNNKISYFTLPPSGLGVFNKRCNLHSRLFVYETVEKSEVDMNYSFPFGINKNISNPTPLKLISKILDKEKMDSIPHYSIPREHSIVSFWGTCFTIVLIFTVLAVVGFRRCFWIAARFRPSNVERPSQEENKTQPGPERADDLEPSCRSEGAGGLHPLLSHVVVRS